MSPPPQLPDDWLALRAIYGIFDDDTDEVDEDNDGRAVQEDDQAVRFIGRWVETTASTSSTSTSSQQKHKERLRIFCGTVFITASSSSSSPSSPSSNRSIHHDQHGHTQYQQLIQNVSFVRLVNEKTGDHRYFQLCGLPSVKVDFIYAEADDDDNSNYNYGNDNGPESVRVEWQYFPIEWPCAVKDKYLQSLQSSCDSLLEQTRQAFSICKFLEHDLISSYGQHIHKQQDDKDEGVRVRYWSMLRLGNQNHHKKLTNHDVGAENDVDNDNDNDQYNPNGYRIIILPPEPDTMYHENFGTLLNPRKEAEIVSRAMRRSNILKANSTKNNPSANSSSTKTSKSSNNKKDNSSNYNSRRRSHTAAPVPLYAHCKKDNLLDFTRLALIECWKQLYATSCPICLEDKLYDNGITFKKCQHYCCQDCFKMYLKYIVADLSQHRTNPFLCPVESCSDRELPFATICRRYLGPMEQDEVSKWYRDLTFPPCWSLDRCLNVKECGAVGSMRRKTMPPKKKTSRKSDETETSLLQAGGQAYNYYGDTGGPPVDAAGFFHHGVMAMTTPVSVESQRRKADEKKIQDEIKRRTQVNALSTSASSLITCDQCKMTWCELCLHRVGNGQEHDHYDRRSNNHTGASSSSKSSRCEPQAALKFCRQYLSASDEEQEEIQSKYPWIVSYAMFYEHDGAAVEYLQESGGQRCPNCRTGVERSEGCFHIKCFSCATHFCYECGDELFPPYYGTHHCWEENQGGETTRNERQNRQDEEFAIRLMLQEALGDEAPDFDV
mmetsp:Transcript_41331/g.98980  ORF Transcript_41331/g.98980 Transcript_41331/m.98980 type:complete len:778 (-) Transcript_41331:156-2489(-)